MIFQYYVIGKDRGFRRDYGGDGYNTVAWPSAADRFYSRKLAVRVCREDIGEFVLGPYIFDDGGPMHLVHEGACPQCGAVPIKEEAHNAEVALNTTNPAGHDAGSAGGSGEGGP